MDRQRRRLSPWHSNFLAGVVSSSLPSMSGGPAQRAMPGSLYPVLTQLESQRRLQLQYRGLAPMALQGKKGQNCTCCPAEGTGFADLGTRQDLVSWLGCHVRGEPSVSLFPDQTEKTETTGLLYRSCGASLGSDTQACRAGTWEWAAENNQKVMAGARGDSIGRQQVIALREEEEGGLLCSTAERGREQQMWWEAEGLDASLHPLSLRRSAVMKGWCDQRL